MSTNNDFIDCCLKFYAFAERLKGVERDNWLSNGKTESVAAHSWMMGMLALVVAGKLEQKVDLERVLKIILVHDLAEAKTGDLPLCEALKNPQLKAQKAVEEIKAMDGLDELLPLELAREIFELWREYENNETPEAKFVKALDKIEANLQANTFADIRYWKKYSDAYYAFVLDGLASKYTAHEPVLAELHRAVRAQTEQKMREAGLKPENYRTKKAVEKASSAATC